MSELLFWALVGILIWCSFLWITEDKYKDGQYVPIRERLRSILKRLLNERDSQDIDDT